MCIGACVVCCMAVCSKGLRGLLSWGVACFVNFWLFFMFSYGFAPLIFLCVSIWHEGGICIIRYHILKSFMCVWTHACCVTALVLWHWNAYMFLVMSESCDLTKLLYLFCICLQCSNSAFIPSNGEPEFHRHMIHNPNVFKR